MFAMFAVGGTGEVFFSIQFMEAKHATKMPDLLHTFIYLSWNSQVISNGTFSVMNQILKFSF